MPGPVTSRRPATRPFLVRPPGVYRPQHDTQLLRESLATVPLPARARVLDVGTGTGTLAVLAAEAGAGEVIACDISRRALAAAWVNTRLRRLPVRVHRGNVAVTPPEGRFDVVLANPPYVPWPGIGRPCERWDAGGDGRAVIDPLCATVPGLLAAGGSFLLVQSALCGVGRTVRALTEAGLTTSVVGRRWVPFGPVLRRRVHYLEQRGLIDGGQRQEELVVIRGERTDRDA